MKILSLNLCLDLSGHSRKERLDKIINFVNQENVDILLLQEGVRSCLLYNTISYLSNKLNFNNYQRSYLGVLFFQEWRLGILSKNEITETNSCYIEIPQKEWLDALPIPFRRRVIATKINNIWYVNVHLSSSPKTQTDRESQVNKLLDFVKSLDSVVVLGGDFNFDKNNNCFKMILDNGFKLIGESIPDFIFVNNDLFGNYKVVLNDGTVTDHKGGILVGV
jgi:endonuclease/exonuclease/phosphatase family metal-dependent hydrolase